MGEQLTSDRSLDVEMKYEFGAAGPFLGQSAPASVAHACCTVSHDTVANEIDVDVLVFGLMF
jgi:hypothetical protein